MSEAEKLAVETSVIRDLTGVRVFVGDLVGSYVKVLSEDGAGDVVRHVRSKGWEFVRETPALPVSWDEFVEEMTGLAVTVDAIPFDHDRSLVREGAESLWSKTKALKWHVGKVPL
jgi:hypothetical protein